MSNLWHRNRKIRDALYRAQIEAMEKRPEIVLLGEGCHQKLRFDAPEILERFPGRYVTLPISEDGNTNFAVGLAIAGLVPIVDVISSDFLFRTMDAICNTAVKQQRVAKPRTIVIRSEFFGSGPTSGQRVDNIFRQVAGLDVYVPQTPAEAYETMCGVLDRTRVSLVFEDRNLSDDLFGEAA